MKQAANKLRTKRRGWFLPQPVAVPWPEDVVALKNTVVPQRTTEKKSWKQKSGAINCKEFKTLPVLRQCLQAVGSSPFSFTNTEG